MKLLPRNIPTAGSFSPIVKRVDCNLKKKKKIKIKKKCELRMLFV